MDSLRDFVYGDSLAIISLNLTYSEDSLFLAREEYYGIMFGNVPVMVVDGFELTVPGDTGYFNSYKACFDSVRAVNVSCNLALTAEADSLSGHITMKIVFTDSVTVDSVVALIAVCQDSVSGYDKPFFNYVAERMFSFPVAVAYDDTVTEEVAFDHRLPVKNLRAVAFVQSYSTHEVMQARVVRFEER